MTYEEKLINLDAILFILKENKPEISIEDLKEKIKQKQININEDFLKNAFFKMYKDGFILQIEKENNKNPSTRSTYVLITEEGLDFEGYVKQKQLQNLDIEAKQSSIKSLLLNKWIMGFTILSIFIAGASLFLQLKNEIKNKNNNNNNNSNKIADTNKIVSSKATNSNNNRSSVAKIVPDSVSKTSKPVSNKTERSKSKN